MLNYSNNKQTYINKQSKFDRLSDRFEENLFSDSLFRINASITQFNDSYYCAHRSNNLDKNNKNYLTKLTVDFGKDNVVMLIAENENQAFEDVRLFVFRNSLMAIYTCLPFENGVYIDRFIIGIGVVDVNSGMITHQQELMEYGSRYHEKNWTPLVEEETLYLITDIDPYVRVLIASGNIGNLEFSEIYRSNQYPSEWQYGELRGGTPFIKSPLNDSWHYSFVHSSLHLPNGVNFSRFYTYTILRFRITDFKVEYYSQPLHYSEDEPDERNMDKWKSSSNGEYFKVVFPMGIINYESGVIISFGKNDYSSKLQFYSWSYLLGLFSS